MKKLNRRQTLLYIRQVFRRMAQGRTCVEYGMCYELRQLLWCDWITQRTYCAVKKDIANMNPGSVKGMCFYWPLTVFGAEARVNAITKYLKTVK